MNQNKYLSHTDMEHSSDSMNSLDSAVLKSNRFESPLTFSNHFTKYNINTSVFTPSKKIKYNTQNGGVPVGVWDDQILVDSSDAHTMVIGATGSKKSRLVVMPTVRILADSGESMIVSDPKAEIYERTSGYLKSKGYHITVVNLRDPSVGNSWNPLHIPYQYYEAGDLDKAYEFANDIAVNLCLAEVSSKDPYWDFSARDLFFGLELLLFRYCSDKKLDIDTVNIANLLRLRNHLFKNYYDYGNNVITDKTSEMYQYMRGELITYSALNGTISAPEKTQASILSVFDEKLRCFSIQPTLLNQLSSNNVSLDDVGDRKTAVFLIMPDEKTSYHKLVTLFIKQSYEYIIYQAQKRNGVHPIRVNYLLDEFASLPTLKDFPVMISAARSRNIRFTLVVQSKHQLLSKYEQEASTIQSNCGNWIFLTTREIDMLQEISTLCGKKKNTEKPLVPMTALQHFDKDKGEALVMSGRLYPFITRLPDIKKYDNDQPLPPVPMEQILCADNDLDFEAKHPVQQRIDPVCEEDLTASLDITDIEKELEQKFDELFGLPSDSDEE